MVEGLVVPNMNTGTPAKEPVDPGSAQSTTQVLPTSTPPPVAPPAPQIAFGGTKMKGIVIEGPEELASLPRLIRALNFGKPGTAKTHLGLDMPSPVIAIDTESRVHIISKKFKHCNECDNDWFARTFECPKCGSKNIGLKDIRRIKVHNVIELEAAIDAAIIILKDVKNRTGKIGTIMVDSWTESWNMVHEEHYDKYYSGLTPSEIKLSPRDDYKHINPRHNKLRSKLLASGFNVYLTATEGDVYGKEDAQFDIIGVKPEGQRHNPHSVDWWIHSFLYGGKIAVMFEKNSIAPKDGAILYEFDYEKLCKTADKLENEEKMLSLELIKQIQDDLLSDVEEETEASEEETEASEEDNAEEDTKEAKK